MPSHGPCFSSSCSLLPLVLSGSHKPFWTLQEGKTLHGLLQIYNPDRFREALPSKKANTNSSMGNWEEPGLCCSQEHDWLQNVLENMQNAAK